MPLRIFLVEDSPVICQMMIEALDELLGERIVGSAATEAQAISAMRISDWDVALVDLFLESGSGLGVASFFRMRDAGQRIYVVTNYATDEMRARCLAAGVDAVYDKSTELDALFSQLEALQG